MINQEIYLVVGSKNNNHQNFYVEFIQTHKFMIKILQTYLRSKLAQTTREVVGGSGVEEEDGDSESSDSRETQTSN